MGDGTLTKRSRTTSLRSYSADRSAIREDALMDRLREAYPVNTTNTTRTNLARVTRSEAVLQNRARIIANLGGRVCSLGCCDGVIS